MREILFRGKRIDNGEWVTGDLVHYSEYRSDIYDDYVNGEIYDVFTKTVGQYAGIDDKKGRKIFEGDIVITRYLGSKGSYLLVIIKWYDKKASLCCFTKDGEVFIDFFDTERYEYEVIGNITDNPEMLGEEQ